MPSPRPVQGQGCAASCASTASWRPRAAAAERWPSGAPREPSIQPSTWPRPAARATAAVQAGSSVLVSTMPRGVKPCRRNADSMVVWSSSRRQVLTTTCSSCARRAARSSGQGPTEVRRRICFGAKRRMNIGVKWSSSKSTGQRPRRDQRLSSSRYVASSGTSTTRSMMGKYVSTRWTSSPRRTGHGASATRWARVGSPGAGGSTWPAATGAGSSSASTTPRQPPAAHRVNPPRRIRGDAAG